MNLIKRLDCLRGGRTLYIEDLSEVEAEIYGVIDKGSREEDGEHAECQSKKNV